MSSVLLTNICYYKRCILRNITTGRRKLILESPTQVDTHSAPGLLISIPTTCALGNSHQSISLPLWPRFHFHLQRLAYLMVLRPHSAAAWAQYSSHLWLQLLVLRGLSNLNVVRCMFPLVVAKRMRGEGCKRLLEYRSIDSRKPIVTLGLMKLAPMANNDIW
ncbi:hypothetical protein AG1IA_04960 [Rhizoctonia solani AG-1 IA]|uniref:Uncharacterized protein n=1 Tax=Thanatephorus cucumeris (strain AG1-IA) TaxID=983506 RepID=L8WS93_THACA|nr:hypothetical protein AG1IA_04960 [Rhizoctonia solani AG-1 IA]